jgi:hypothetical protein
MWSALAQLIVALLKWLLSKETVEVEAHVAEEESNPDFSVYADPDRVSELVNGKSAGEDCGVHKG